MTLDDLFMRIAVVLLLLPEVVLAQSTWRRSYGGSGADNAASVRACADGGFIVVGTTGSFGNGSGDLYALRLDPTGDVLWSGLYGGIGVDQGVACAELSDGYVFAATTADGSLGGYDMRLIRTDASGDAIWTREFGSPDWDLCRGVEVLTDGFLIFGVTYGQGSPQGAGIAFHVDWNGDQDWSYTCTVENYSELNAAMLNSDGSVLLAGSTDSGNGDSDGLLTLLQSDGSELWTVVRDGSSDEHFRDVESAAGGGWVICGDSRAVGDVQRILISAYDANGSFQWDRYIGNTADAGASAIRRGHGSGFVITGYNSLNAGARDMIFTRLDDSGWFQNGNNYGDGRPCEGLAIDSTSDGGYVLAGWVDDIGPGPRAFYVVKVDADGQTASLAIDSYFDVVSVPEESPDATIVAPNPALAGGTLRIELRSGAKVSSADLYGTDGRFVESLIRIGDGQWRLPRDAVGLHLLLVRLKEGGSTGLPLLIVAD